jgi:hypothetical protein
MIQRSGSFQSVASTVLMTISDISCCRMSAFTVSLAGVGAQSVSVPVALGMSSSVVWPSDLRHIFWQTANEDICRMCSSTGSIKRLRLSSGGVAGLVRAYILWDGVVPGFLGSEPHLIMFGWGSGRRFAIIIGCEKRGCEGLNCMLADAFCIKYDIRMSIAMDTGLNCLRDVMSRRMSARD